jgi:fibronectin type 3 domain-containing protein
VPSPARCHRPVVETLEGRTLLSSVTFGVIGDYGSDGPGELGVANRVKSWNPDFIVTVGDNNYDVGAASTIDANVGKYYSSYISPYRGSHGSGSADGVNRFFPALGNHDWDTPDAQPYRDYFTLPGNERYYSFTQGPVQFFILDSDDREPDLGYVNTATSTQNSVEGQWLKNGLAASTAPWKAVVLHHSPFSSSSVHGNSPWMQYPYQQWGASVVLSGHDHDYERVMKAGFPYLVTGLGGAEIRNNWRSSPEPGSAVRYAGDYGALKVDASDSSMAFQFVTRAGAVIDSYTLSKNAVPPAVPPAPTNLTATAISGTQININWTDNANNETGYKIERSTDGKTYYPLAGTGVNGHNYVNMGLTPGKRYYYRVYAVNASGPSAFSNVATAVTGVVGLPQPLGAPTGLVALATGTSAIKLTWFDNATAETGFRLERSTDGTNFTLLTNVGANITTYTNTGLAAGARYYYRVRALGTTTNSAWSNVANGTTTTASSSGVPAAPTNLTAAPDATLANTVDLSWKDNANNESGYKVERSTDGKTYYPFSGTGVNATGSRAGNLTPGKQYFFRVYAWNGAGNSPYSNVVIVIPPAATVANGLPVPPLSRVDDWTIIVVLKDGLLYL